MLTEEQVEITYSGI